MVRRTLFTAFLVVLRVAAADSAGDDQSLIQNFAVNVEQEANITMGLNNTPPPFMLYKIVYLESYGADHVCLTEMEFIDSARQVMQARYMSASSCYGCPVKCDECTALWGNPIAQFDMVSISEEGTDWSCTGVGSFVNGVGHNKPEVVFSLKRRPGKVIFRSPDIGGGWVPKSWIMQEQQLDGSWQTIADIKDHPKDRAQSFFTMLVGTAESPAKWPIDYKDCGGIATDGANFEVVASPDPPSISFSFAAQSNLMLAFSGQFYFDWGHGVSMDCPECGNITIAGQAYGIRQVTWNFPSNRVINGNKAEGELHIIIQKDGAQGIFDIAVVDILLQLKEEGAQNDTTRAFFLGLGLDQIPKPGEPREIARPIDLNIFAPHFTAGAMQVLNCSTYVPWYVLTTPAFITGTIAQAFKDGPPEPTPAPTFFNQTLANMTADQQALYLLRNGLNADGTKVSEPVTADEAEATLRLQRMPAPTVAISNNQAAMYATPIVGVDSEALDKADATTRALMAAQAASGLPAGAFQSTAPATTDAAR
jgi:carbonic anhydrase